jgi:hypothetical protein
MQATRSLPSGRVRAFMEQRVNYQGQFMVRQEALRQQAHHTGWGGLNEVIALPEIPIEDDVTWSHPVPDDLDIIIQDALLREQLHAARIKGILF